MPDVVRYEPRGAAREFWRCRDPEVVLNGPAGTGKSRVCLEKLHYVLGKYDGARGLMVRRTRTSLTQSAIVTFEQKVKPHLDGVSFHGGKQEYQYPNNSVLVVAGLDNPGKAMSAEYDIIYVQEAIEVTEHAWESVTSRLRNGVMPYQQLIADTNPDAPTHWLRLRVNRGATTMLESRHEDNPLYFNRDGTMTPGGSSYIGTLDRLTGVRKARLRYGQWAAAEGLVYENFDRALHLIDRFDIPADWRRIRVIDFGYTNPFVCQWWAIDHDGRLYLYRELYETQRLVSDMADRITALSQGERIEATIADHDAEDRATLQANGIRTLPAQKAMSVGIQAVQQRLAPAGDGKPRLYLLRDSLVSRDDDLAERGKPVCTDQEFDSYVWAKAQDGKPVKEEPIKIDDHGMDALRYGVMYVNGRTHSAIAPAVIPSRNVWRA